MKVKTRIKAGLFTAATLLDNVTSANRGYPLKVGQLGVGQVR
jgi:hypothetical protein